METAAAWTIWTWDINTAWRIEGHLASFPILASHLISIQYTVLLFHKLFWIFFVLNQEALLSVFHLKEKDL